MKNFILYIFCILNLCAHAQQWDWAKNISIKQWDYGKHIVPIGSNVYVGGETGNVGTVPSDIFLRKYDLNGNLLSSFTDVNCNLYRMAVDNLGNTYALLRINLMPDTLYIRKYSPSG